MQVDVTTLEDKTIYSVIGRIDATTVEALEEVVLAQTTAATGPILVDFTQVEYISSAGLRVMLKLAKQCTSQKLALRLYGMQNNVFEVFKISGFASIIKILPDQSAALASI